MGRKGAGTNGTLDEQIMVYRYSSSTTSSFDPYLYSSTVG